VSKPPWKPLSLAPVALATECLADGSTVLRSRHELLAYPRCLGEMLRRWATAAPERTFLAERPGGGAPPAAGAAGSAAGTGSAGAGAPPGGGDTEAGAAGAADWRRMSYGAVLEAVERLAGALLARGLCAERPVAILSDNGTDNALLQLAAMHVGIPVAPISPAYSLLSADHAKLRSILEQVRPGLIYAEGGAAYARALAALPEGADGAEVVVSANPPDGDGGRSEGGGHRSGRQEGDSGSGAGGSRGRRVTRFAELLAAAPGPVVAARFAAVGPDTVAKILFTSGSTGTPKGVINTQRMLCSNQQAIAQGWPFLAERPPVIVDWLPWSHTFGGNHNFNMILRNGGTLYIDRGKPAPGAIETTVRNLREVASTLHFNVPRGYDLLIPHLERDERLRQVFFRDLDALFYAAAALPPHLWERLERLSAGATGRRVTMLAAWGSTETAPCATQVHFRVERAGVIGLPLPGTEVKLVPAGDRQELRVRGPNVTPGYWRQEREPGGGAAFDADGFLAMGDAGRLEDPENPERGLVFDGRLAENFKLTSGTWVHVGELRTAVIAAGAPVVQDAVVTGHDREHVGLLIFPNPAACRELCGITAAAAETPLAALLDRPEVRFAVAAGLAAHNAANPASSRRIRRALLLAEPPSIDAGEITDKGYINQRAVLERRAARVERLYDEDADAGEPAPIRLD
jgi:feruloyl-CoA synthase